MIPTNLYTKKFLMCPLKCKTHCRNKDVHQFYEKTATDYPFSTYWLFYRDVKDQEADCGSISRSFASSHWLGLLIYKWITYNSVALHANLREYFQGTWHCNTTSIQNVPHFLQYYDKIYFYYSLFLIPGNKHITGFSSHLGNKLKNIAKLSEFENRED